MIAVAMIVNIIEKKKGKKMSHKKKAHMLDKMKEKKHEMHEKKEMKKEDKKDKKK